MIYGEISFRFALNYPGSKLWLHTVAACSNWSLHKHASPSPLVLSWVTDSWSPPFYLTDHPQRWNFLLWKCKHSIVGADLWSIGTNIWDISCVPLRALRSILIINDLLTADILMYSSGFVSLVRALLWLQQILIYSSWTGACLYFCCLVASKIVSLWSQCHNEFHNPVDIFQASFGDSAGKALWHPITHSLSK